MMGAGLATYHLILSRIWKLEMSELHLGRHYETSIDQCVVPCAGDIPVMQQFQSELLGTFILDIGKPRNNYILSHNT